MVPRLRFPGFSKEWKSMLFGKAFDFQQTNTFSRNQMNTAKGKVGNIHYGDVLIKYDYVLSDISTVPFVNEDVGLNKYNRNSYLQNGDVVIADTAEDLTAGKALEIQNVNCDILAGLHTMLCRPNEQAAPGYWGYYINSPAYHNSIIPLITGSKVSSISKFNIVKTSVVTTDFAEQQKIADCLSSLDDLIAVEDKKLKALKAHKKSLMQKLFPAEGKTVPEIRFEGYTDAWKQQKLGEVAELSSSKRIHVSDYVPEGIPFYRGSEISAGGVSQNGELFISEELYNEIKEKYGVPIEGDLLITAVGTLGNIWKVDDRRFYYKDGNLIRLSNLKIEADYLIAYFSDGQGKLKILDSAAGSSQKALTMVKLNQVPIFVPSLPEQIAISTFFRNLDELITGQAKKIDALKLHKKGLMQGLFPSIEEVSE